MLAGEVTAVEVNAARARELRGDGATARRRRTSTVVVADGRALPAELDRLRPRARRRAVLGARSPEPAPRPALAREAAPGAPARAPACGGRARAAGRHDRLLGLHGQRRGVRGRRRRLRARGRSERSPTSGLGSGIRAGPEFLQTLPHVHGTAGLLRRAPHARAEDPARVVHVLLEPAASLVPCPSEVVGDGPAARAVAVEAQRRPERRASARRESALRSSPLASSSRSPTSGFGSITSHGSRDARSTFPPWRSWFTRKAARSIDGAVDVERGIEQRALEGSACRGVPSAGPPRPSGPPRPRAA